MEVVEVAAQANSAFVVHHFSVRYREPRVNLIDQDVHPADFAIPVPRDAVSVVVLRSRVEMAVVRLGALVDVVVDTSEPPFLLLVHYTLLGLPTCSRLAVRIVLGGTSLRQCTHAQFLPSGYGRSDRTVPPLRSPEVV